MPAKSKAALILALGKPHAEGAEDEGPEENEPAVGKLAAAKSVLAAIKADDPHELAEAMTDLVAMCGE